jgi:flagellar biosynthesis/type III secretory pathway protein FliH
MSNGIYLTLEQYKDKDLPITITINGHTYHSQFALATTQTTWFEMGKQHGMELGADNTYSDKEMSRMHDQWYNEGYEAGKKEATFENLDQFNKGYEIGKYEGYEAGKKANGISKKEIPGEYLAHIEEARLEGYKEGYSDAKEGGYAEGYNDDYCKECKEEPGRDDDDGEPIDDNQSEYDKGYYAGWEDGKNHIMQYI